VPARFQAMRLQRGLRKYPPSHVTSNPSERGRHCARSEAIQGRWKSARWRTASRLAALFLTIKSNDVVLPIHAKAMPVPLTIEQEIDTWLDGSVNDAIALQRPLPNEFLRIVAMGEKSDQAPVGE
jgi:hypothetical protein